MNLIKEIILDFLLFSLIEGYILSLFYERFCNCRKMKFSEILFLSFINSVLSKIFAPLIYQVLIIIWITIYLYLIKIENNIFICFKFSLFSMIFILIIEATILFVLDILKIKVFYNLNEIKYIFFISIKLLEIILIKGGSKNMKLWFGGVRR